MSISAIQNEQARPINVAFLDDNLIVHLLDGRTLSVPLWWYPRLLNAGPKARAAVEMSPFGLHWPAIDEDISIESLLMGKKAKDAVSQ